ncbi:hypothetical protein [Stenotrophomonas phage IME-SM1]|uniref:Uncharacterized protein n=1 Tax=Stenotrophomonas phage IME-SM1 TaxID=1654717 RepID=A0A0H4ISC1_9CAUD|nr:hypothetical protein KMC40_gp142 [Stenotrophomonas phage IME-SM1]AKO61616.1 hypothetical protein [Stenotrophomonas phage IME-SM1]QXN67323.1 hypothetical protein [Stenotrophomonas phage BUCT608]QYC97460.1 hypothetical protein [Stenotrophomonas phage BUCT608]
MKIATIKNLNLTPFQEKWAQERSDQPDFDSFVHTEGADRDQGVVVVPYYTKDGKLHAARLGKSRLIREV